MNHDLVVLGSVNVDLVTRVEAFPVPGETLLGSDYETHYGGKGANQAVAAARMGASTRFVGMVGSDAFGTAMRASLAAEGIDVDHLGVVEGPSGAAFITIDAVGQNTIIVAPGANGAVRADALSGGALEGARVLLMQLEVPVAEVEEAMRLGARAGAMVVVNASPVPRYGSLDLSHCDVLVVNETEAAGLLGGEQGEGVAQVPATSLLPRLAELVPNVILSLGAEGVAWASGGASGLVPAHVVPNVVDTTGAGDAMLGAVASALAGGADLAEAVAFGNAAGALAVTKRGAQPSLPYRVEVEALLRGASVVG